MYIHFKTSIYITNSMFFTFKIIFLIILDLLLCEVLSKKEQSLNIKVKKSFSMLKKVKVKLKVYVNFFLY